MNAEDYTDTDAQPANRGVTLSMNAAGQACLPAFEARGKANYGCVASRYVVTSRHGTTFHGAWWYKAEADYFARSMGPDTEVKAVPVYWYAWDYGPVTPD